MDVKLFASTIEVATALIIQGCNDKIRNNHCVSATGAHGLVHARKNECFRKTLGDFYLNLPDGMPGVWVGRLKGAKNMRRCYGPSVFQSLMISTKDLDLSHFFCGGNQGVADELKASVKRKFQNDQIVGTLCPPYLSVDAYDYDSIADQINRTGANIVWIGLSTPKQELFAFNLSKKTNVNYIITVGAAFDFHTDKVAQAPILVQKLGLEWMFRLLMEPRRLFRRYLEIVPLFIYYNLKELINFVVSRKNN